MKISTDRFWVPFLAATFVATVASVMAFAEEAATTQPSDSKVLSGPKAEKGEKSAHRGFGGRREGPGGGFHKLIEELGITEEQKAQIAPVMKAHHEEAKAWRTEHADEMKTIMEEAKAAHESGNKEAAKAATDKAKALRETGPTPAKLADKIKPFLTPEQIATLDAREAEIKKKMEERRAEWKKNQGEGMNGDRPRRQRGDGEKKAEGEGQSEKLNL